jgi:hypothetical protein
MSARTDRQTTDAPDLAGHGSARRLPHYSIESLAQDLGTRINGQYDIMAGGSFGGPILLQMVLQLGLTPRKIVLCDPVLDADLSAYPSERIELMASARNTLPPESELLENNPTWEQKDASVKRQSILAMDAEVVRALFFVSSTPKARNSRQDAANGQCTHKLLNQAIRQCPEIVIIAADPNHGGIYPADHTRPHGVHVVRAAQLAHDMHRENHEFVTSVILSTNSPAYAMGSYSPHL